MLDQITKSFQMKGDSIIDGKRAAGFNMSISSENPINMSISSWIDDAELYKANIAQCREDENAFRKKCQDFQDKLIKEGNA